MSERRDSTLLLYGPDSTCVGTFAYAVLNEVNKSARLLIYTVEHALSYLIAHHSSVVVQAEVGSDVETLEHGVRDGLLLQPDIAFIGGIHVTDSLPSLPELLGSVRCVVLSMASKWPEQLMSRVRQLMPLGHGAGQGATASLIGVQPGDDGRLQLTIEPLATRLSE